MKNRYEVRRERAQEEWRAWGWVGTGQCMTSPGQGKHGVAVAKGRKGGSFGEVGGGVDGSWAVGDGVMIPFEVRLLDDGTERWHEWCWSGGVGRHSFASEGGEGGSFGFGRVGLGWWLLLGNAESGLDGWASGEGHEARDGFGRSWEGHQSRNGFGRGWAMCDKPSCGRGWAMCDKPSLVLGLNGGLGGVG